MAKRLRSVCACAGSAGRLEALRAALAEGARDLSGPELDSLLHQLWDAKQAAEERERRGNMELLLHFLQASREDKGRRLGELQRELRCLEADIVRVEGEAAAPPPLWRPPPCGCLDHELTAQAGAEKPALYGTAAASVGPQQAMQAAAVTAQALQQQLQGQEQLALPLQRHSPGLPPYLSGQLVLQQPQQAVGLPQNTAAALRPAGENGRHAAAGLPRGKRQRICSQFEDLQACYLRLRADKAAERQLRQGQACTGRDEGMGSQASGGGEVMVCSGGDGGSGERRVGPLVDDGLQEFSRVLSVLTRYNKLQVCCLSTWHAGSSGLPVQKIQPVVSELLCPLPLPTPLGLQVMAEIPRPSLRTSPAIISSLDFDPEGGLFATAGVSRRISIYDYAGAQWAWTGRRCQMLGVPTCCPGHCSGFRADTRPLMCPAPLLPSAAVTSAAPVHVPLLELATRSKLSCLSWNRYVRSQLACSDYDGATGDACGSQ